MEVNGTRMTVTWEKQIKRPYLVEMFFKYFSVIDLHDHLRQGSLGLEKAWKTKTWWPGIFATIFGVV